MSKGSISSQLRDRREKAGLTLAEVARRAGTSAATLSRYENGWSRFETYTLRKLATSLNCDLRIELVPRRAPKLRADHREEAIRRLDRLFWDHDLAEEDLQEYAVWVFERVLEYGHLDDIERLRSLVGKPRFLEAAACAERVSPKTRAFWQQILEREGITCTKRYSRLTAWNS